MQTKPTKTGYLFKKGIINKKWQKRWFSLGSDSKLNYHKTPHDKYYRSILLEQSIINYCTDPNNFHNEFGFVIITPQRVFYLYAENKIEQDDWMKKLTLHSTLHNENLLMEQAEQSIRESMTKRSNLEDELLRRKDSIYQHLNQPVYHPFTPITTSPINSKSLIYNNNGGGNTNANRQSTIIIPSTPSSFTTATPSTFLNSQQQQQSSSLSSYHRYSTSIIDSTTMKPSSFSSFSSGRNSNTNTTEIVNESTTSTPASTTTTTTTTTTQWVSSSISPDERHMKNLKLFEQINNNTNINNISIDNSNNNNSSINNNSNLSNNNSTKKSRSLSFSFKKKTIAPS